MFKLDKIKYLRLKIMLSQVDFAKTLNVTHESCDRSTGFPSYSEFVGFYQVNVSNMI
jgi:hypothetical protein